ncbi:MAG: cellulose binding domain-containing protein [Clostridiales bacterium]
MNKKKLYVFITLIAVVTSVIAFTIVNVSAAQNMNVSYDIQNDWDSGSAVNVTVKNDESSTMDGWTIEWTFSENQKITEMWGATYTQDGTKVTVENVDWNSKIDPGSSVNFGFLLSYSGSNNKPTDFKVNSEDVSSEETDTIVESLDTPEIKAALQKAIDLAGDDESLIRTQRQQCKTEVAESSKDPVEPIQLFDNLYYIGNVNVGTFIFTTTDGYIMIDSGYDYMVDETIIPGMEKLGLDPAQIKYLLITHSGPDHVGGAEYFQKNYGTQIVMSEEEWVGIEAGTGFANLERDIVAIDGDKLTLGDTSITMVSTKRRVDGGGFSYIAQVFDNGEPHMWATYGNTNVVGTLEDKEVYRESVAKFLTYVDEYGVDVVISNHPFVDGSVKTMEELRNRQEGEPNPFVRGKEKARLFFEILDQSAVVMTLRQEAGLDETGTKLISDAEPNPWD